MNNRILLYYIKERIIRLGDDQCHMDSWDSLSWDAWDWDKYRLDSPRRPKDSSPGTQNRMASKSP